MLGRSYTIFRIPCACSGQQCLDNVSTCAWMALGTPDPLFPFVLVLPSQTCSSTAFDLRLVLRARHLAEPGGLLLHDMEPEPFSLCRLVLGESNHEDFNRKEPKKGTWEIKPLLLHESRGTMTQWMWWR